MNNADYEELKETLETEFVDKSNLATVMEMLSDICHDKAEHLRSNWQDENTAKLWEHDAEAIISLSIVN